MRILEMKVMRGPNYWSVKRHKLIVMTLDIEELEELPTNKIEGFSERMQQLLPGLYEHYCSEDHAGGFVLRVKEGTWMGHVVEHIALEIQTMAGMDVGFGRTRSTNQKGVYNVVFAYMEEVVGKYAARAAVQIADALVKGEAYDLEKDIATMRELRNRERFGPSTGAIVDEATARGIPYIRINTGSLVQLGYGKNQVRFRATMTERTSSIAMELASNKEETKRILQEAAIPVAEGETVSNIEFLEEVVKSIGFPLVLKPVDGNHGRGATINVNSLEEAKIAFETAKNYSNRVLVEKFVVGKDFRALIIDHKFVAAALREPAQIKGDAKSTIQQLIDKTNLDPRRGEGHENILTKVTIERETEEILKKKGYTLETVLRQDEIFYLKGTANISTGGTAIDVTDSVHPHNIMMFERISRLIGLDICGIDIMAPGLDEPLETNGGVILEVNAAPGFRMHIAPSKGIPRNVAAPVIDMLYPPGKPWRIPIISITGTNGKTTTTRLIAHIVKSSGQKVGYTTSDGIYVGNLRLAEGDTTGPASAEFILKDPTVDFAVLECARGGILRSGLGFDMCDVGVITNIQEDHIGLNEIHSLDEMAKVKAVIAESVKPEGYAVLNADDKHCVNIGKNIPSRVAYFSMNENNPVIKAHCKAGGLAAVYENGYISIKKGEWKFRVNKVNNIPLTFDGKVSFMIQNVLAATLATYTYGFKPEDIAVSLETFIPSAALTPGRMNTFHFKDHTVLIDFAHNPDGFRGVKEYLSTIDGVQKIGLITGTGDRRDEDLREMGRISASMFDHILLRQDLHYLRGRTEDEIVNLLIEGILDANPAASFEKVSQDTEILQYALSKAMPGAYIVALSNVIPNALDLVKTYIDKEKEIHAFTDFE